MSAALPELGPSERRLLLSCARVELDPADESALGELVREPLDWDAIVFFAHLHSVAPLVHRHLEQLGDGDLVPDRARGRLLALAHRAAYQNRIFARENAALVADFDAADVPVIVPKGISVVELVYGDLELRPLIDLLFLVAPHRLAAGGGVMLSRGYTAMRVRPPHAAYQWLCPQRWFRREDASRMFVLLKAHLVDTPPRRHRFTPERLWPEARPASVAGHTYLTLAPTDQVLYLCLQGDCHGHFNRAALGTIDPVDLLFAEWSHNRLVRFVDIHEAVRHHRQELDWDRLVARARSCGIEDAAHSSLVMTNALLGDTAPAEAIEALSGRPPPRLRQALLGPIAQSPPRPSPPRGVLASGWERLGQRRQKELFRLIGLLEVAFPGLRALRAEDRSRSAPRLLGTAASQAATTMSRSVSMFLQAAVGRRGAPRSPAADPGDPRAR
ncbi:MAG: nucleotidyltransferase domain-containing protein [Solirubrobacterales bacterium]